MQNILRVLPYSLWCLTWQFLHLKEMDYFHPFALYNHPESNEIGNFVDVLSANSTQITSEFCTDIWLNCALWAEVRTRAGQRQPGTNCCMDQHFYLWKHLSKAVTSAENPFILHHIWAPKYLVGITAYRLCIEQTVSVKNFLVITTKSVVLCTMLLSAIWFFFWTSQDRQYTTKYQQFLFYSTR